MKFRCLRKIIDFKPPQPHRVIDVQICEHEVSFVNLLGSLIGEAMLGPPHFAWTPKIDFVASPKPWDKGCLFLAH
jgi:hypothetical protein